MATKKKTTKPKKENKELEPHTKTVRFTDSSIIDILVVLFDKRAVGTSAWIRTGERRWSTMIYLQRKTSSK